MAKYKLKTRSGAKKRFTLNKKAGKVNVVLRADAYRRHNNRKKTSTALRQSRGLSCVVNVERSRILSYFNGNY